MRSPERLALCVDQCDLSYGELAALSERIAAWLLACCVGKVGYVGILASRSLGAYAAVLGACWAGGTYIPISLKAPEERLLNTLKLAQLDAIIADRDGARFEGPIRLAALRD